MSNRTVLISGGGIAGSTLAYWLARRGWNPTVVERAPDLRSSGSAVDVRGQAVDVAEAMGISAQLHEAATRASKWTFVDSRGRRVGGVDMRTFQQHPRDVEIARGELATALYHAARDQVEYLFNDSISSLHQDRHGIDVTFMHSPDRRFDLLVGADGLHSAVRRMAFNSNHIRHMGMYVATLRVDAPLDNEDEVLTYNTPGKAVTLHPERGHPTTAFMFRSPELAEFDHHDTPRHKSLLLEHFQDEAWRVPELLDYVTATDDLYFDAVSQISLPRWSTGRIALIGDAASCVSLFGEGSSLAITGAATLAHALADNPTDHRTAFTSYEAQHQTTVRPKQRHMNTVSRLIVPNTRTGILLRNTTAPLLTTGLARIMNQPRQPAAQQQLIPGD